MRVLHVIPTYWPAVRYGGPIVSAHGLCRALVDAGNRVVVYTTNIDGGGNVNMPLNQPVYKDGVEIWYFESERLRRLFYSKKLDRKLKASAGMFDIIHCHAVYLWPTLSASRAALRAHTPYVISPRGMLVPELIQQKSTVVKKLWLALVEKRNISRAAAIHFTSKREQEDLDRLGMRYRRPIIVPNGIDVDVAPLGEEGHEGKVLDDRYILYLGRLNWKKGIDDVIRALRYIRDVTLIVAGNDEEGYKDRLEDIATSEGVRNRVSFIGAVSGRQKWRLLEHAEVVILASESENFGNVILEGMAMGRPVIVTEGVGLAEAVRRSGAGLVIKKEPKDIAAAVNTLLEDGNMGPEMGERGRRCVIKEFTWLAVASKMEGYYKEIIGSYNSGPCVENRT